MAVDKEARAFFDILGDIEFGVGKRVLFWRDRWIHGFAVKDIAPYLHALVDTRTLNRRTVEEGLQNARWLLDISGEVNFGGHLQLLHLNLAISTVNRDPTTEDSFSWPADPSGGYTAKSTYLRLCFGAERVPYASCIWKSWALLKCNFLCGWQYNTGFGRLTEGRGMAFRIHLLPATRAFKMKITQRTFLFNASTREKCGTTCSMRSVCRAASRSMRTGVVVR